MRILKLYNIITCLVFLGCAAPARETILTLPKMEIRIVGYREQIPVNTPGTIGAANSDGIIWVVGTRWEGKIHIDPCVLGHEVTHILSWKYPQLIGDPDGQ